MYMNTCVIVHCGKCLLPLSACANINICKAKIEKYDLNTVCACVCVCARACVSVCVCVSGL